MRFFEFLQNDREKELFKNNREAVSRFLASVMRAVTFILGVLMGVMSFISFKFGNTKAYKIVYLTFFILSALFFIFFYIFKNFSEKHSLFFVFFSFILYLGFAISANYSAVRQQEYVSVVCAIFIIPVLILDKSWRVNFFVALPVALSVILSYKLKDATFFRADLINLFVYTFAGIVIGRSVRKNRLKGFEAERVLTLERNTDALTKLSNRRKLFEYLRRGIDSPEARPNGMFMMDIDHFKQYNDHYGHRAGDICLSAIGSCFEDFGKKNGLKFFRYGGEEFCALCWTKNQLELAEAAERLLQTVRDLQISFPIEENPSGVVTISLGYASFDWSAQEYDFEGMIKSSDAALYCAKSQGRNCARG